MNIYIMDNDLYKNADWSLIRDAQFVKNISEADVLAVGLFNIVDQKITTKCPNLKYILSPTTGTDHIKDKSIPLIHLVPEDVRHIKAASEFSFLLILYLLRRSWLWNIKCTREELMGDDLDGKNLGIVGFGRIGSNLSNYSKIFGANVLIYDKMSGGDLEMVLSNSDIIVVCITASEENRKFFNKEKFDMMLRCPYFINISRGFIVDDNALLSALVNGKVRGAALDVVENKSVYNNYKGNNLIFTHHIAGNTYQSRQKACHNVIKKLADLDNG